MMKRATCLLLYVASFGVTAQSIEERLVLAAQSTQIEEVIEVPIRSLKAVESEGQIVFMSDNGRYVLVGQIYDILARKSLDTMSQIKRSVSHIDIDEVGLAVEMLNTLQTGRGEADVVAFVDPLCQACNDLIAMASLLSDTYTFKFIFVPALGGQSAEFVKRISCTSDEEKILTALKQGAIDSLTQLKDCDLNKFNRTLVTADLLGVNGVPFIVAPNGEILRGLPEDLSEWLLIRSKK